MSATLPSDSLICSEKVRPSRSSVPLRERNPRVYSSTRRVGWYSTLLRGVVVEHVIRAINSLRNDIHSNKSLHIRGCRKPCPRGKKNCLPWGSTGLTREAFY